MLGRLTPSALFLLLAGNASFADPPVAPLIESKLELFVHDAEASTAFYATLGFVVSHQKDGGYTTLSAGSTVIALSPMPWWLPTHWLGGLRYPPTGTEIVLYFAELDGMHEALANAGHAPGEITLQPWGDRDFRVRDPDGYYVRVSQGTAVPTTESRSAD
jgi:catechol 2,3-dioxygenase-like lactoylglutathione lyase family enzyme